MKTYDWFLTGLSRHKPIGQVQSEFSGAGAGARGSNAFVVLEQPVVQEDAAFLTEELFALFLDAHDVFAAGIHRDDVGFVDRFIKEPLVAFDFLAVNLDDDLAEELVEIEFDQVFFSFADFDAELHNVTS
ncbi:MAG: hypothetical protein EPO07_00365 [Verrucomicrobia bacterium]|nr:MAG: hypothetical protein EPO07_00365 [Verrucomicrobiota bacterium]